MLSVYGVDHGYVAKRWGGVLRGGMTTAGKGAIQTPSVNTLKFKPIVAKTPTGPGSKRAKMSQSAWETQTAAKKR